MADDDGAPAAVQGMSQVDRGAVFSPLFHPAAYSDLGISQPFRPACCLLKVSINSASRDVGPLLTLGQCLLCATFLTH